MENRKIIRINDSQLNNIIVEHVVNALRENNLDEGFLDNIKAGWQGARQGFNAQKNLDRGTNDFKQYHDYDDFKNDSNPLRFSKSENTAEEQAQELLRQAQYFQTKANQLKAQAQKITAQYGLAKTGVNQRVSTAQVPAAPSSTIAMQRNKTNGFGRTNTARDTRPIGPWGK